MVGKTMFFGERAEIIFFDDKLAKYGHISQSKSFFSPMPIHTIHRSPNLFSSYNFIIA